MASTMPSGSDKGSAATGGNRLASASFLLAIVAPLAAVLAFALLNVVSAQPSVIAVISEVLYAGGLLAGLAAIVLGVVALARAKRYAPQQRWRGPAIAGLVLGLVVTVLLVFPGGFFYLLDFACAVNHQCI